MTLISAFNFWTVHQSFPDFSAQNWWQFSDSLHFFNSESRENTNIWGHTPSLRDWSHSQAKFTTLEIKYKICFLQQIVPRNYRQISFKIHGNICRHYFPNCIQISYEYELLTKAILAYLQQSIYWHY